MATGTAVSTTPAKARSRGFMRETGLVPHMLSKSRLTRRLHRVAGLVNSLFHQLGMVLKEASPSTRYLLDSFPVSVCDNMRISRCRLVKDEEGGKEYPQKSPQSINRTSLFGYNYN